MLGDHLKQCLDHLCFVFVRIHCESPWEPISFTACGLRRLVPIAARRDVAKCWWSIDLIVSIAASLLAGIVTKLSSSQDHSLNRKPPDLSFSTYPATGWKPMDTAATSL